MPIQIVLQAGGEGDFLRVILHLDNVWLEFWDFILQELDLASQIDQQLMADLVVLTNCDLKLLGNWRSIDRWWVLVNLAVFDSN